MDLSLTNNEIAGLLREHKPMKKAARNLRMEMLKVAADELGMAQDEALQANLDVFLDAYLFGQGRMQS